MSRKEFWKKYGTFIVYNLYGFSATILETLLYWVFYRKVGMDNVPATVLATFIAITYAFFTNKVLVYKSMDWRVSTFLKEISSFYGFRIATAIFNVGFMYLTVDIFKWMPVPMKAMAALIVGLMNYLIGKKLIFINRRKKRAKSVAPS